uniref:Uncharacterized protein n=1 Tax=Sus scrofa TaxID=9823 RepID=A0A8D0XKV6_PIG
MTGDKNIQWRKESLWENRIATSQRMKLEHSLIPYTKINSKWIKDLNIRPDTMRFLEKNIGTTLSNINHNNIFLHPSPRVMEIKTKINKWNPIKLKSFCMTKEPISRMKRQPTEWEKIFANNKTNKRLISKIHKTAGRLMIKKQTTQSKKG